MAGPKLTDDEVRALVESVVGATTSRVTPMTFSGTNSVRLVETAAGTYVLRANVDPVAYAGTVQTISALAELGLPAPRLLHIDLSVGQAPFAWMLLEAFDGTDLRYELPAMSREQMTRLATRIAGFQRKVRSLPAGEGYGWIGLGMKAPYASWEAIVRRDAGAAMKDARAVGRDDLARRLEAQVDGSSSWLSRVAATPFLDDATTKNVIVRRGELTGIVDLDVVCYGDSLYHPALLEVAVEADIGEAGRFYVEELKRLWPFGGADARRCALYAAIHGLDFAGRFLEEGKVEDAVRMTRAVERWLRGAGG